MCAAAAALIAAGDGQQSGPPQAQRASRHPPHAVAFAKPLDLPSGEKLQAALRLPMRSRVVPLTMRYWGDQAPGVVLLDSLAQERLHPRFNRVRWHRWLPDGSLALLDGERLYRVAPDGQARFLAAVGRPQIDPRLSPDTRWVAVAAGPSLALVPTDGGAVKRLAQPGRVHSMGWHPDSRRLAFAAGNRIRVVTIDGALSTLRVEPASQRAAWGEGPVTLCDIPQVEWSSDGEWLAYRLVLRGDEPDPWETRVRAVRGGQVTHVDNYGYYPTDGLFSWSLSGHTLVLTGNYGDPDSSCWLWTPTQGNAIVSAIGTPASFRRSSWQPRGNTVAVEEAYCSAEDLLRAAGPVASPSQVALFAIPGESDGPAREDAWPTFEWSPWEDAFCELNDARVVARDPRTNLGDFCRDVGDFVTVTAPDRGQVIQIASMGDKVSEVQWQAPDRVTMLRQTANAGQGLFAAAIRRTSGGRAQAEAYFAAGQAAYQRGSIEQATVAFRNAARCSPDWAEPRLRLARCYLDLSQREDNPACALWLLDGAEFEIRNAESLTALSQEGRELSARVEERRRAMSAALHLPTERWWSRSVRPRPADQVPLITRAPNH